MKQETKVIFIYEGNTRDVLAVFPELEEPNYRYQCYSFIGEHSTCSHQYLMNNEEAKVSDILPLYDHLISLGYNLRTKSKYDPQWLKSVNQINEMFNSFF